VENNTGMYYYQINQFDVESDIELPCDLRCRRSREYQDLVPLRVRVQRHSLEKFPRVEYFARGRDGKLRIYNVGTGILMRCGDNIALHVDHGGTTITLDMDDVYAPLGALYAIAIGMGTCTMLRGDFPLHAAGVEIDGKVIALMADTETGKSTASRALLRAGARFVSDDMVVARLVGSGGVSALPSISLHAKASREALLREGRDYRTLKPVEEIAVDDESRGRYWDPVPPEKRVLEARPLSALFVLQPFSRGMSRSVCVRRVSGVSVVKRLVENMMGSLQARSLLHEREILTRYLKLASRLPVYTLEYPKYYEALPDISLAIRDALGTAESAVPAFRAGVSPTVALVM
jgi:hypothetical protein